MYFPDNTRPCREVHRPRYLDDYVVHLPKCELPQTHTHAGHSTMGDSRLPEPEAGMSLSGGQSLQAQISEEVLSALKQMKEENLQIRREMQQVINALTPHLSAASQTGLTSVSAPTPAQLNFRASGVVFQRHLDVAFTSIRPARRFAKQESDVHDVPWPFPSPPAADQADDQLPPPPPPVSFLTPQGAAAQSSPQRLLPSRHPQCLLMAELADHLQDLHIQPDILPVPAPSHYVPTPGYTVPYTHPWTTSARPQRSPADSSADLPAQHQGHRSESHSPHRQETIYCGPKPRIPDFNRDDPRQFARLKLALKNLLPAHATERFKFQILVDHLKLEDALLIADS